MTKSSKQAKVMAAIQAKTDYFSYEAIAVETGVSAGYIVFILNQMISQAKVVTRKNGRKTQFRWVSNESAEHSSATNSKCSVPELFDSVESLVNMVGNEKTPSALVTGTAGIGKTYLVMKALEACGVDAVVIKGHSSPLGLFEMLYENNGSTIVFDDCDSIFDNEISVNILKAALDSYDKRTISWLGRGIGEQSETPNTFDFTGRIVFISNLDQSKIDESVKSRTLCINLALSRREITERMSEILEKVETNVPLTEKQEVLAFLHEHRDEFDQYNLRTLLKGIRVRSCNPENWQLLVQLLN